MAEAQARIALLHYWLLGMRGGEKVVEELCTLFPNADIFTHVCNPERISAAISRHRIFETGISRLPGARRSCQKYLPLMFAALRKLDLGNYDLLISSESGPAKGIRKPPGVPHICYCHTPMRYLWDLYDEYRRSAGPGARLAMCLFRERLRRLDRASAEAVDHFIANSRFVAERIFRIYHRDAEVIHPPVDTEFYSSVRRIPVEYYLFAGQLIPYKHPELAVEACRRLGRPLVVVGEGPMRPQLEELAAGGNVTFAGRVSDEALRRYYAGARALLFPGCEDFGIVPVEAQAAGTPVIALGRGGALETVRGGETGLFFLESTADALIGAMLRFEAEGDWDEALCRANAEQFSRAEFRRKFRQFVREKTGVEIAVSASGLSGASAPGRR